MPLLVELLVELRDLLAEDVNEDLTALFSLFALFDYRLGDLVYLSAE